MNIKGDRGGEGSLMHSTAAVWPKEYTEAKKESLGVKERVKMEVINNKNKCIIQVNIYIFLSSIVSIMKER